MMNTNCSYLLQGNRFLFVLGTMLPIVSMDMRAEKGDKDAPDGGAPKEEQKESLGAKEAKAKGEKKKKNSFSLDMADLSHYRYGELPALVLEVQGKKMVCEVPLDYTIKMKIKGAKGISKEQNGTLSAEKVSKKEEEWRTGLLDLVDTCEITWQDSLAKISKIKMGRSKGKFSALAQVNKDFLKELLKDDFSLELGWHPTTKWGKTFSVKMGYKKSSFKVKFVDADFWLPGGTLTLGKSVLGQICTLDFFEKLSELGEATAFLKSVKLDCTRKKKGGTTLKVECASEEWKRNEVKYSGKFEWSYTWGEKGSGKKIMSLVPSLKVDFSVHPDVTATCTLVPWMYDMYGDSEEGVHSSRIGIKLKYVF